MNEGNGDMIEQKKEDDEVEVKVQNQEINVENRQIDQQGNSRLGDQHHGDENIEQEEYKVDDGVQRQGYEGIELEVEDSISQEQGNQQIKVYQQMQIDQEQGNKKEEEQNVNEIIQNVDEIIQNVQRQYVQENAYKQQEIINQNNQGQMKHENVEDQNAIDIQIQYNNEQHLEMQVDQNQMNNQVNQQNHQNVQQPEEQAPLEEENIQNKEPQQQQQIQQGQQRQQGVQRQQGLQGGQQGLQAQQREQIFQGQQGQQRQQEPQEPQEQQRQQQVPNVQSQQQQQELLQQAIRLQKINQHNLLLQKQKQKVLNDLMLQFKTQNESYLNKLQRKLDEQLNQLQLSNAKNEQLQAKVKAISEQSERNKNVIIQLRKIKLQTDKQNKKLSRELQKHKKQSGQYRQKLLEVEKIGNVFSIKQKCEEYKILTNIQNEEIMELKNNLQEAKQNQNKEQEHINIFRQLQHEINISKDQIINFNLTIEDLQAKLIKAYHQKQAIDLTNSTNEETIRLLRDNKEHLEGQLKQWQVKWQSLQQQRQEIRRLKEVDKNISQFQSERNMGQETNIPKIYFLSDKQEKQILLKEFLILQTEYEKVKYNLQLSEKKIKTIQRENKYKESNFIRKKEYLDLATKYKKAKICLEGTFIKLKQRSEHENVQNEIREEINQLLEGNEAKLCQNIIRQTTEHLKYITDRTTIIQNNDELNKLRQQNQKLKEKTLTLQRQMKSNEKVMFLLNDEIELKKKIISQKTKMIAQLINNGYNYNNEHYEDKMFRSKNEIERLREELIIFQTKNIMLIKENSSFLAQINHWKQLYNSIKENFVQRISTQHEPSHLLSDRNSQYDHYNRQAQIRYEPPAKAETSSIQCQTENLYDLHYKEIKQSLMVLKNLKTKIQAIPESSDKSTKIVLQCKDKFQKVLEKYNGKLMQLQKEKAENDNWRLKIRQEIKLQFQDIRDLISSNRLVTALRQAKSLIDYLQNEQQKMQGQDDADKGEENEEEQQMESQKKNIEY